jgi:hypothetical protein
LNIDAQVDSINQYAPAVFANALSDCCNKQCHIDTFDRYYQVSLFLFFFYFFCSLNLFSLFVFSSLVVIMLIPSASHCSVSTQIQNALTAKVYANFIFVGNEKALYIRICDYYFD